MSEIMSARSFTRFLNHTKVLYSRNRAALSILYYNSSPQWILRVEICFDFAKGIDAFRGRRKRRPAERKISCREWMHRRGTLLSVHSVGNVANNEVPQEHHGITINPKCFLGRSHFRLHLLWEASPSKNRPQPPTNNVSPENTSGASAPPGPSPFVPSEPATKNNTCPRV